MKGENKLKWIETSMLMVCSRTQENIVLLLLRSLGFISKSWNADRWDDSPMQAGCRWRDRQGESAVGSSHLDRTGSTNETSHRTELDQFYEIPMHLLLSVNVLGTITPCLSVTHAFQLSSSHWIFIFWLFLDDILLTHHWLWLSLLSFIFQGSCF